MVSMIHYTSYTIKHGFHMKLKFNFKCAVFVVVLICLPGKQVNEIYFSIPLLLQNTRMPTTTQSKHFIIYFYRHTSRLLKVSLIAELGED